MLKLGADGLSGIPVGVRSNIILDVYRADRAVHIGAGWVHFCLSHEVF